MSKKRSPVREYRTIVEDSGDPGYVNRLLIATPVTGLVRIEWVGARYGQIIPVNWAMATIQQYLDSYYPLRYQVADAQNLCVRELVNRDFEWLFFLEHDVVLPPDAFLQLNAWIQEAKTPIVSGLYYTRSIPAEPLIFRGRGTSYFDGWKMGDVVYCDGVPTGCLLIHSAVLREMWKDSPEYLIGNQLTRRVFNTPRNVWQSPDTQEFHSMSGTSDLEWCSRVIEGDYLRKAGWGDYVNKLPDPRWPFVVDTRLFCRHIEVDGRQFP